MPSGHSPKKEALSLHLNEDFAADKTDSYHMLLERNIPLEKTLSAVPSFPVNSSQARLASDSLHGMSVCVEDELEHSYSLWEKLDKYCICYHFYR